MYTALPLKSDHKLSFGNISSLPDYFMKHHSLIYLHTAFWSIRTLWHRNIHITQATSDVLVTQQNHRKFAEWASCYHHPCACWWGSPLCTRLIFWICLPGCSIMRNGTIKTFSSDHMCRYLINSVSHRLLGCSNQASSYWLSLLKRWRDVVKRNMWPRKQKRNKSGLPIWW